MSATTDMEIKISNGRIISSEIMPDGSLKVTIEPQTQAITHEKKQSTKKKRVEKDKKIVIPKNFLLVEASKLSLDDKFMKYEPYFTHEKEKKFKALLSQVIKNGVKDFYRPIYDPSPDEKDDICFEPGAKAIFMKNYNWWEDIARKYEPKLKSRLGTKSEYIAFLGVLIKRLVEIDGYDEQKVWYNICEDSRHIANYEDFFDITGGTMLSDLCGFYDLGNTRKILADDEESGKFWMAGGSHNQSSSTRPVCYLEEKYDKDYAFIEDVGWIVLEKKF